MHANISSQGNLSSFIIPIATPQGTTTKKGCTFKCLLFERVEGKCVLYKQTSESWGMRVIMKDEKGKSKIHGPKSIQLFSADAAAIQP